LRPAASQSAEQTLTGFWWQIRRTVANDRNPRPALVSRVGDGHFQVLVLFASPHAHAKRRVGILRKLVPYVFQLVLSGRIGVQPFSRAERSQGGGEIPAVARCWDGNLDGGDCRWLRARRTTAADE